MNTYIKLMFQPLKKYFQFSGRACRTEFWMFFLFAIVGSMLAQVIGGTNIIPYAVFSLAIIIPTIAVGVRRLHDIDYSGWWYLVLGLALPALGAAGMPMLWNMLELGNIQLMFSLSIAFIVLPTLALLVMYIFKGTQGHNRFGDDPLNEFHSEHHASHSTRHGEQEYSSYLDKSEREKMESDLSALGENSGSGIDKDQYKSG